MEEKSGRRILLLNIKEENEKIKQLELKDNKIYKSHKNLLTNLDLIDKTKENILKQNLFNKIKKNKLTRLTSLEKNNDLFLTTPNNPILKKRKIININVKNKKNRYESFVNIAIEKIKNKEKFEFNKVIEARKELNKNNNNIITNLFKKNQFSRNPSQKVLSNLYSELNKISFINKSKKNLYTSIKTSPIFPPINYNNINKPIKIRNISNFNLRKDRFNILEHLTSSLSNNDVFKNNKNNINKKLN